MRWYDALTVGEAYFVVGFVDRKLTAPSIGTYVYLGVGAFGEESAGHHCLRAFGQSESDQAPYQEVFLSLDGASVVSESFDVPADSTLRVAFYLHFVDPSKPLETCYGDVSLPSIEDMPERLAALTPYEPVT